MKSAETATTLGGILNGIAPWTLPRINGDPLAEGAVFP